MIVLNKLAKRCVANAVKSRRVCDTSGLKAYLMQATVHLNLVYGKTKFRHDDLPKWSEYEVAAAEVICWLVAFLERLGCINIEDLVRDVIQYRATHPDIASRND